MAQKATSADAHWWCNTGSLSRRATPRQMQRRSLDGLAHRAEVLPDEREIADARSRGGLMVLVRRDSVPTDLQSIRAAHQAEEDFLRSTITLAERVHVVQLRINIR